MGLECSEITEKIIGCFYEVYNSLGYGFLEKVYVSALAVEFERVGLRFGKEVPVEVCYKGERVGEYFADFIVGDVVIEVKAKSNLNGVDEAQLLNYLKGTGKGVGLLFNFGGEKPEFRRKVFG